MTEITDTAASNPAEMRMAARWRRFLAFLVDYLIMMLPLVVVGFTFMDFFASLGEWGKLIGLAVTVLYFTFFDGSLGGGRSPGKRLLKIAVIGTNGLPLSASAAALRALVLSTPYYLPNLPPAEGATQLFYEGVEVVTVGIVMMTLYLFIFNGSRRSLHDIATGAVAIDTRTAPQPFDGPLWRGHWIAMGALSCALLGLFVADPVTETETGTPMAELQEIATKVSAAFGGKAVRVGTQTTTISTIRTGTTQYQYFQVAIPVTAPVTNEQAVVRQVEDILFPSHAALVGEQNVVILFQYGFTFGPVLTFNSNSSATTSQAQWRARTSVTPAQPPETRL